ncbi:flagellar biosynthetic protein FliR [Pseudomonadales bacterium]|nr:flagellar biosynthetic protein FliR [Pseudomonadales bacterium]
MVFDPAVLITWLVQFILPFFRIAAFLMVVPVFGNQLVAVRVRLLLALSAAILIFPLLPDFPVVDPLSLAMFFLVFEQLVIGAVLGFMVQLFFHIFVLAGQMVAMQMGLGFASMVDPTNGVSVAVVSQFYVLLVTLLFLSFNGHLVVFEVMVEGFTYLPIGAGSVHQSAIYTLAAAGGWMFASALLLALPAVTAILIVNFAFGVMTRAAPQLNIFSLGFPFTLLFGIFILWVALAGFLPQYQQLSKEVFVLLNELLRMR